MFKVWYIGKNLRQQEPYVWRHKVCKSDASPTPSNFVYIGINNLQRWAMLISTMNRQSFTRVPGARVHASLLWRACFELIRCLWCYVAQQFWTDGRLTKCARCDRICRNLPKKCEKMGYLWKLAVLCRVFNLLFLEKGKFEEFFLHFFSFEVHSDKLIST